MNVTVIIAHDSTRGDWMLERCTNSVIREGFNDIIIETTGNKSEARNNAASKALGEILVFLDDDLEVRRGCFRELLSPFSDERVGVVGGVNIAFPNISLEEQIGASLLASPITMFRSSARYTSRGDIRDSDEAEVISCIMAVRSNIFKAAGGFCVSCLPCEENVLINKVANLGYKIIYNPFAIVYHRRPKVFKEYAKTIFRYGKGRGIMMRTFGKEGKPKMLWSPNKKWLYYVLGFFVHYISYLSGVIWGLINGSRVNDKATEE